MRGTPPKPPTTSTRFPAASTSRLSSAATCSPPDPGRWKAPAVVLRHHAGRKVWHDVWLTEAAVKLAKRDLAKLGITDPAQLEQPLPEGIKVRLRVGMRRSDDGREFNDVSRFDVIAVESPEEPFALALPDTTPAAPAVTGRRLGAARAAAGQPRRCPVETAPTGGRAAAGMLPTASGWSARSPAAAGWWTGGRRWAYCAW
ncbi:MAG: hypothetical protein U0746_13835 [Gemmataceae bacterium]